MGSSHHHVDLKLNKFEAPQQLQTAIYAALFIGFLGLAYGLFKNPDRLWTSYLVAFFYFSCLGLGGMFFIAINHATNAGWSSSIRRIAESFTSFLPAMFVGSLVLILGFKYLYAWADPSQAYRMTGGKALYLAPWFVIVRLVIFGIGCLLFKKILVGNSIKQDQNGDSSLTQKSTAYSVGFIAFFAIFFTLFSIDLLMSLLPSWYSTIYGIYAFAGLVQSTMAVLALMIIWLRSSKWISGYITVEHQHDIGKYLKGFTIFWAYIAFSQFMLIWYANIPEETEFYLMRSHSGWLAVSMALLVFRFAVPFLALLPRDAKRNNMNLAAVSILVLVMQYVDIYWLVYPNFFDGAPQFGFLEISVFVGFSGIFMKLVTSFMTKNNLVAIKDPRLNEALNHHVTY